MNICRDILESRDSYYDDVGAGNTLSVIMCMCQPPGTLVITLRTHDTILMHNWRPPGLSELTLIIFDKELTHLNSKASN